MARRLYEKRSFGVALIDFLEDLGWMNLTYSDRNKSTAIKPPEIAVTMPPSSKRELQLGRQEGQDSVFKRIIQVDAYMESEERADAIIDDIMDFIDLTPVIITDPGNNDIGTFICQDSETIFGESLPPITTDPAIGRWRGIVRAQMEAHYPNS
jgi:hypothetical protein